MELCEFQKIDPSNNLVYPWLTHPALEEIQKWNLDGLSVLEYGAGLSTLWWASKCKEVYSIEANQDWFLRINEIKPANVGLSYRPCNEGDQSKIEFYTSIPEDFIPDIVVVDGILRYECIQKALTLPRPLTLIVDNWQQDQVFICPAAEDLMKDYEGQFYVQTDHRDHNGRPWQTGIWNLK
jgi:hypothetical protein